MESRPASRRRFLGILLGLSAWAFVSPAGRWLGFDRAEAEDVKAYGLADFFKHRKSAEVIGREYLMQSPDERNLDTLLDRLLDGGGRGAEFSVAGAGRRREMLRELTREDFARGRVVKVGGWILSLTEARLCALAGVLGTSG